MELEASLTLQVAGKVFANPKRMTLLEQIEATGSISKGAAAAGISYKSAWDAVDQLNTLAATAVVERAVGGKGGGGARLTPFGQRLVQMYQLIGQVQNRALMALQDESLPMDNLLSLVSRISLQTSARNQLVGPVLSVSSRDHNDLVEIELAAGQSLFASVTRGSTERLQLAPGKEVVAMIKAFAVRLLPTAKGEQRHNQLQGTIEQVTVMSRETEVALTLAGGEPFYALIENHSADLSWLSPGLACTAAVSPRQVLLATLGASGSATMSDL